VAIEFCPLSNLCIKSTHIANSDLYPKHPVVKALEAGVDVVLGTDDANAWEPGAPGPCMRATLHHLLHQVKISSETLRRIALNSFEMACMPDDVRSRCKEKVRLHPSDKMHSVPICDLHMHFAGSVPREYLEKTYASVTYRAKICGKAQAIAQIPILRRFNGTVISECTNPWDNLAQFAAEMYAPTYGVLLSAGVSDLSSQITAIAESCSAENVIAIMLQIGFPQGYSAHWTSYCIDQMVLGKERSLNLSSGPCYIAYQADFIRNAPVAATGGVLALVNAGKKVSPKERWVQNILSNPQQVQELKAVPLHQPYSPHPTRLPALNTAYDLLLLVNSYGADAELVIKGLAGFGQEIKSVSSLPHVSPFRVRADDQVFGSDTPFEEVMTHAQAIVRTSLDEVLLVARNIYSRLGNGGNNTLSAVGAGRDGVTACCTIQGRPCCSVM